MNCCNDYGQCRQGHGCPARDSDAMTMPEAEAQIAELLAENSQLAHGMHRAQADLAEMIDQIERIDLGAWAQIKYAHDNGLPIPQIERPRASDSLPIVMLDDGWIDADRRRFLMNTAAVMAFGFGLFMLGVVAASPALP